MSRISRGRGVTQIGLSNSDLADRVGIAVGWVEGEVLPPFDKRTMPRYTLKERLARASQALRVQSYAEQRSYHKFAFTFDDEVFNQLQRKGRLVEVVGGLSEWCVANTVEDVADAGFYVLVSPKLVISHMPLMPQYWVGKILIRNVLKEMPDFRCHVFGNDLIFYKA